jgi:hypothetical protein
MHRIKTRGERVVPTRKDWIGGRKPGLGWRADDIRALCLDLEQVKK